MPRLLSFQPAAWAPTWWAGRSPVVTMVVFAPQYAQHLLFAFAHGDDVCRVLRLGRVNDFAHHVDAVLRQHVGDVLTVVRQRCEQASVAEVVGQVFGQRAPRQVGVAANHDALRIVQPRVEGLETLVQVARRPVGHVDDKRIARFAEGERILSIFGDDEVEEPPRFVRSGRAKRARPAPPPPFFWGGENSLPSSSFSPKDLPEGILLLI